MGLHGCYGRSGKEKIKLDNLSNSQTRVLSFPPSSRWFVNKIKYVNCRRVNTNAFYSPTRSHRRTGTRQGLSDLIT